MKPVTYQDLIHFVNIANGWLSSKPSESKLTYAVRKVLKRAKPLLESYAEQFQDLAIAHAVEVDQVLKQGPTGDLVFSRAGLIARKEQERALTKSDVSIEPYWVATIPKELSVATIEAFTGFVFEAPADGEPTDDLADADGTD